MKRILILLLALLLLSAPALAEEYEDGNPQLSLELYFRGNPTTGYAWTYEISDPEVISVLESEYMPDDFSGQMTGAGGMYYFRVDGLQSGAAEIKFTYSRSFEEGSEIATSTYRVMVDENLNVLLFDNILDI